MKMKIFIILSKTIVHINYYINKKYKLIIYLYSYFIQITSNIENEMVHQSRKFVARMRENDKN